MLVDPCSTIHSIWELMSQRHFTCKDYLFGANLHKHTYHKQFRVFNAKLLVKNQLLYIQNVHMKNKSCADVNF